MRLFLVFAALSVLVLTGCGGTELDSEKLEETLPHDLRTVVSEPIKSADCPSGVDVEKGVKFDCTIVLESGKKETAHLRLTDSDADYEFLSTTPQK